jgi:hypothetical protein
MRNFGIVIREQFVCFLSDNSQKFEFWENFECDIVKILNLVVLDKRNMYFHKSSLINL